MAIAPIMKKKYRISQKYGNKLIINGKEFYKQFGFDSHMGVDFSTPVGTPLFAGVEGTVEVKYDTKGYGNHVIIVKQRTDGVTGLLYAHLSKVSVKTGDKVKVGDVIGESGNTGASTGPHLHLGLRLRDKQGKILNEGNGNHGWIDAMDYFEKGKYSIE